MRAREMPPHQKNSGHFLSGPLLATKLLQSRGLRLDFSAGCIVPAGRNWLRTRVTERDGTPSVRFVNVKTKAVQKEAP